MKDKGPGRVPIGRDDSGTLVFYFSDWVRRVTTKNEIVQAVSPVRFQRYEQAAHMAGIDALDLYVWNSRLSASLFELVGHVEVVVRTAMSRGLDKWSQQNGGRWCSSTAS